ncbi:hypothetical protein ACFOUR_06430 [Halovivax cerinus]|uniref:DUF7847 domain-containing protein n=2 Tax=Halovivax cerinus TaxID=1487865 RepID=A0ABD5NM23_9EURY
MGWLRENPALILVFLVGTVIVGFGSLIPFLGALFGILALYINGIAQLVARDELVGETPDIRGAAGEVLGRLLSLVGIWLISSVLIGVGFLFLIIPGIYLALRLSLAPAACVIDGENAFDSLSTSWEVAEGNLLKIFGLGLIVFGLVFAAMLVTTPVVFFAAGSETGMVVGLVAIVVLISAFAQPVVQMAYARIYVENREPGSNVADSGDDWAGA